MDNLELVQWIVTLLKNNNIKAFYNSSLWLHTRSDVLERDHNECQKCKAKGLFNPADCVHHEEHLKEHPELAVDKDNLISLCNECHNEEHPEKFLKYRRKKKQLNKERW
jgi:5-methylcytosine-specific restriction endonuclease McrA